MKKLILLLIVVCALKPAYSQNITFNKLINSYPGTTVIRSIISFDNSYYCLIGQLDTPNLYQYTNYVIFKLDNFFNVTDSSSLIDINKTIVLQIGHGFDYSKLDSSLIICTTIKYDSIHFIYNGYIAKFDKNLDTLWTKQIAHPDTAYADTAKTPWTVLTDVKVTATGDYLIAGNYNYHCQGDMNRSFIIKMDGDGNIIWQKLISSGVAGLIKSIEIDPIDSGFYFITAVAQTMLFSKMDKDANFKWSMPFTFKQHPTIISDCELLNPNTMIIAYTFFVPPIDNSSILRLSVTSINLNNHSINWSKDFYSIGVKSQYLQGETIDIEFTKSNKIAIGNVSRLWYDSIGFTWDNRANILLLNQNGDSLWSHYYTYNTKDTMDAEDMQFNDMVVCDDGGFLFGGSCYYNKIDPIFLKAWLVKTDSNGIAPGAFTVSIKENELIIERKQVTIFPNPANEQINLQFSVSPRQATVLSIYSLDGKLVKQEQLPVNLPLTKINIEELKSGVYLIKIVEGGKEVFSGKIVKE